MKCPKCSIEAAISATKYVTEGDNSPDTETKLYIEQHFTCRNPCKKEPFKVREGRGISPVVLF